MQTQSETAMAENNERVHILTALRAFAEQRPGLDPRNYISSYRDTAGRSAYFAEARSITKDLRHARELLAAVAWRSSIGPEELKHAIRHAFAGRLSWDGHGLNYCTGQYWPTEYRKAVCAVLASALWAFWREDADTADDIRRKARRELSRGVAQAWFA